MKITDIRAATVTVPLETPLLHANSAQSNNAPQEVVDQIRNSGTDTFNSADEVLQAAQGRL
jgi:hypothetical protein